MGLKLILNWSYVALIKGKQPIFYNKTKYLKGKEHKNTNDLCLKVFGKLHILMQTVWKLDTYFWS